MTFRILTVCTGNICRSPLAEQLLRRDLAGLPVDVSSAGVGALVGYGMPDQARRVADRLGIPDAADHVARQLNESHLAQSDLVLAMARDHRRSIVELAPSAMRRVFTVREMAHIVDSLDAKELRRALQGAASPEDALRAAVAFAAGERGLATPPADPTDFDVLDPYRRSDEVYDRSAAELAPAAVRVAKFLRESAQLATA